MTDEPADCADDDEPFWRVKPMKEMSKQEWESLCDGCGQCCLVKLEFVDEGETSGDIAFTDVACKLLDPISCRCRDYKNRFVQVPDCLQLSPDNLDQVSWLPETCGYRLVAGGKDLLWWHPLISGSPETVHDAGISVRSKTVSESELSDEEIEQRVTNWLVEPEIKSRP